MKNRNYFIYLGIPLVIVLVIFFVYFFPSLDSEVRNDEQENNVQSNPIENIIVNEPEFESAPIPETFDVEKIGAPIELDASQISILESPDFSIPKNIEGVEMMGREEKETLGLDPELNIQVLGRNDSGQPTGYQFIYSEEDFVLDLR